MPGAIIPSVPPQYFDNNGDPLNGGKLYSYSAGTSTPLATYSDSALSVPNANPLILDSSGRGTVFLADASYKFILKDSSDVTIWTRDNISSIPFYNLGTTIASGSATADAWTTSGNTASLTIPKHPVVVSCIYDTPTTAINIPAGTLAVNDDCLVCEWDVTYSSADIDARCTAFGTNIDLGAGAAATTVTVARCVFHRNVVGTVQYSMTVQQDAVVACAQGSISSLDLDNTAYTINLTMASGTFAIRGHRILFIPALTDWTA